MKRIWWFVWSIAVVGIAVLTIIGYTSLASPPVPQPPQHGLYDNLTKCLTSNGAIMYGQTNCHACLYQMELLGTSFSYINETNCTDDYDYCSSLSIGATPTWMINGSYYVGIQTPEQLAGESGCAI